MVENNYSVHFTNIVMNDLDDISRYILEGLFAESAATELLNQIENCIMRLKGFPNLGNRLTDE